MKTIAIVATGGTIAGTGKKGKTAAYHAGEIDIDSIIETIPEINEVAHIKEYQLMNIDSNEMTHEKWLILKNNIEESDAKNPEENNKPDVPQKITVGDRFRHKITGNISEVVSLTGAFPWSRRVYGHKGQRRFFRH